MPLASKRSGPSAEVVIVGGGVIGLTIARALAMRGVRDVLLIEKNEFGREASWAAGGILAPQVEADARDDFFRLACASRDLYPQFAGELVSESGIDVELDTTGTLYVGFDDQDEIELRRRLEWQLSERLRVQWLSGDEARREERCLSAAVRCALRFPDDYQIENRKLLAALIQANRKLGVRELNHCEAVRLASAHDEVSGVEAPKGFISTRKVVIAAGAWSSIIDLPESIFVEPIRGQMLCFKTEAQFARHVIYSSRGYLIPRHDRRLLAGSTSERAGFEKRVTDEGVKTIKSLAREIAPTLAILPLHDSWAGFRPRASDGLPVLGASDRIKGLFHATGHFRNGILLAPITGELIADEITEGRRSSLLEPFSPARLGKETANRAS